MLKTLLQKTTFWRRLTALALNIKTAIGIFSHNALYTMIATHQRKSIKTTGLSNVMQVVRVGGSISQKHSQSFVVMETTPTGRNYFAELYAERNQK